MFGFKTVIGVTAKPKKFKTVIKIAGQDNIPMPVKKKVIPVADFFVGAKKDKKAKDAFNAFIEDFNSI